MTSHCSGKPDVLIDVVDADQEAAVLVVDHLVAAQVELECEGEQQDDTGATQEARFQAAFQVKDPRVEFPRVAQVRHSVAQLPAARCQPVHQNAEDDQRQNIAAQQRVERKIEQIEGERLVEHGVAPGGGGGRQSARAGEADHGPVVDGAGGDKPAEGQQDERGEPRVEAVLAEARAGELQGARVGDPQCGESQQCGGRDGSDAVVQHAQPGVELAQFLPPFDLDGVAGKRACAEQEEQHQNQESNAGRGRTAAAGRYFIPGHLLRVAPARMRGRKQFPAFLRCTVRRTNPRSVSIPEVHTRFTPRFTQLM